MDSTSATQKLHTVRRDLPGGFDQQAGLSGGDATRHLRAAAYLDRWFRDAAIVELVENRHRIPAPSPGVDSAQVLEDCLLARRWAVIAATLDLAIGVIGLIISIWAVVLAVIALVIFAVAAVAIRGLFKSFRSSRDSAQAMMVRSLMGLGIGIVLLFLVIYIVIHYAVGAGAEGASGFAFGPLIGEALIVMALWTIVGSVHRYNLQGRLASLLLDGGRQGLPGSFYPHLRKVFERLQARESEAETVYGGFNAFVGSGLEDREEKWSFAVELRPNATLAAEGRAPGLLETPHLHEKILQGLAVLSGGTLYPGDLLRRISVRDRLFRSGMHDKAPAHWYGKFSAIDPATNRRALVQDWADELDLRSHERLRHYLEARVELWERQVVASVFLRIHVQGKLLQMEGLPFVLPPVKPQYRLVDEVAPLDPGADTIGSVTGAVLGLPKDVLASLVEPLSALASVIRSSLRQNWYRRMLAAGFPVDYGPNVSLRELGAESNYRHRFQEVDVYRFFASVRKRVATAVLDAMRENGYDTSEFEQFVQSININNGIQNYDSLVTGPQAAGSGAKAG